MGPIGSGFYWLSKRKWPNRFTKSPLGKRAFSGLTKKFLAGEDLEEAASAARKYEQYGIASSLSHVGEDLKKEEDVEKEAEETIRIISTISEQGIKGDISVKPSHLGYNVKGRGDFCYDNLKRVVRYAKGKGVNVEIDMEGGKLTDYTIELYLDFHEQYPPIIVALQANHEKAEKHAEKLLRENGNIRLVKGAYSDPKHFITGRVEVDRAYKRITDMALYKSKSGSYRTAIATHDAELIRHAEWIIGHMEVPKENYEFQMLHGVRTEELHRLAQGGHPTRVYLSYGEDWFPYVMRRLAERPSNAFLFIRSMLQG
ncbi:MAG: proline dehydrogenase family protein [Candidatus Aenigmarchaeota archaeon]|nr:proline dehydrogenase family protein [Candidatus Aenigmarchaeota archaeon]